MSDMPSSHYHQRGWCSFGIQSPRPRGWTKMKGGNGMEQKKILTFVKAVEWGFMPTGFRVLSATAQSFLQSFGSSVPSPQSSMPSQNLDLSTHMLFLHIRSLDRHWNIFQLKGYCETRFSLKAYVSFVTWPHEDRDHRALNSKCLISNLSRFGQRASVQLMDSPDLVHLN